MLNSCTAESQGKLYKTCWQFSSVGLGGGFVHLELWILHGHLSLSSLWSLLLSAYALFLPNGANSFTDSYTVMPEVLWLGFAWAPILAPTLQNLAELSVSSNYRANRSPHCATNTSVVLCSNIGPTTSRCVSLTTILRTLVSSVKQRYGYLPHWAVVRTEYKCIHCS